MTNLPYVSVIIPTFNSQRMISYVLKSLVNQDYDKRKLEVIVVDGGSSDSTLEIVQKYNAKVIKVSPRVQNVEYNKSLGIERSKGEFILFLDHDNLLISRQHIRKMIQPFIDSNDIVGVETLRYHYSKKYSLLDRYIALFGVTDPIVYYLGKADRLSYLSEMYPSRYFPIRKHGYSVVSFNESNLTTIGANGFMIKKSFLKKAKITKNEYFHTDINMDLVRNGFNTYAFIDEPIAHIGGKVGIFKFLKRRLYFMKQYSLDDKKGLKRRYRVYEKKDFYKLILIVIIIMTIVIPLLESIRGYLKIRDLAWFLHPFLSIGFVIIYGYAVIQKVITNKFSQ